MCSAATVMTIARSMPVISAALSAASCSAISCAGRRRSGGHVESLWRLRPAVRIAYNSCRNRHCPKCQGLARAEWLADRQAELLPVPYFHVVFTVPRRVAAIAFQNKAMVYAILFRAAAETLPTIAADPRHLGAEIGCRGAAHLGSNCIHHPHLHCLVPGGGLSLGSYTLDRLPTRLLPACPRALPPLPAAVPEQLQAAFAAGDRSSATLATLADRPPSPHA